MTGRTIFKKLKHLIIFFKYIIFIIPRFVLNFIWLSLDNSESKIALFYRFLYISKYCESCGENIYIGRNVTLKNIKQLTLGNNISIHAGTYIDAAGKITIKDNVSIACQSSIISFEHGWENTDTPIKYNKVTYDPIVICDDVWIGTGCRILSGVTINTRSIVAAGAVVNTDVNNNTIVGGVPAKIIKKI